MILISVLAGCGGDDVTTTEPVATSSATTASVPTTTANVPTTPAPPSTVPATTVTAPATTTTPTPGDDPVEAWSAHDAERHVINFLAALADGAYEQAAWPAHGNGIEVEGQGPDESPADAFRRQCAGGACAGPYAVTADGPGLVDPSTAQASSTLTVTHVDTGQTGQIRLATFEGQLLTADLPPLVPSAGEPTLVEALFGIAAPRRVVVQRLDAFEIREDGISDWVTNWWAGDAYQVEGDLVTTFDRVVALRDPQTTYLAGCGRLIPRADAILVLEACGEWRMYEVTTGEPRPTPIPYEERFDGESVWFTERGGAVVHGIGDAEGNLTSLQTLEGLDLLGDDYAGYVALSTDGAHIVYTDHADPAAFSHFWSPVVVVKDTSTGSEVGRWTLDRAVMCLEFAESWVIACEADTDSLASGVPDQVALAAIDIGTARVTRVETPVRVFLPS